MSGQSDVSVLKSKGLPVGFWVFRDIGNWVWEGDVWEGFHSLGEREGLRVRVYGLRVMGYGFVKVGRHL